MKWGQNLAENKDEMGQNLAENKDEMDQNLAENKDEMDWLKIKIKWVKN